MKFEILIAGNDRKGKVSDLLPNTSSFGDYNDSLFIACMMMVITQTL